MTGPRHIAVIDIGKTNAKVALVDLRHLTETAVLTRPNTVRPGPPWPHFDTEGHWDFILTALTDLHRDHGVDAISVTTHGASVVLLDHAGDLAAPILDYEHPIPTQTAQRYDALRPAFAETGSPRLAGGLNVGAQLHYQFETDPDLHARTAHILGYPQYWGHRLTGQLANDVTSIGCHTDLWNPHAGAFSGLVDQLGITDKMAPVRKSGDVLGPVLPQIAQATGLDPATPVTCGIHDSNASLYPHLRSMTGAFSVVSTGTWVIAMTIGARPAPLDPTRDTLINVNALGGATPSARFMGGREFEILLQGAPFTPTPQDAQQVMAGDLMILPAVEPGTGPFQGRRMSWHGAIPAAGPRAVAASYYLALMTTTCLDLTAATGPTIVEGPFAQNAHFLDMLGAATGRDVLQSRTATGTSIGAALLCGASKAIPAPDPVPRSENHRELAAYARRWVSRVQAP